MIKILKIIIFLFSYLIYGQGDGLYKFLSEDNKYGFMDKSGKIIIDAEYLRVSDFSEGLCYVSNEVKNRDFVWIFINTFGNKVFDIADAFPETKFNEGFARMRKNQEQWFINKKGENEFGKKWYEGYEDFKNGIAYVRDNEFSEFYQINIKGEKIGDEKFTTFDIYSSRKKIEIETKNNSKFQSDKFVAFQKDELWGFKDEHNNIVIEPKFYLVDKFENGVCAVRINDFGYEIANDYFLDAIIDEYGKILIKIDMHCYMGFQGELIQFYEAPHFASRIFYLDEKGKQILPKK